MVTTIIGRIVGNYRIEEPIGEGGMGAVYKAVHTEIDNIIAVKVLGLGREVSNRERARYLNEAKTLAALRHPNIVHVLDFIHEDGIFYTLMEYIEGQDLQRIMTERQGSMLISRTARIMAQIGRALDYAHNRGVVHRDIKPANIVVSEDDHTVLTDFGIAKLTEATTMDITREGATVGTPVYMSPEQASGLAVDHRSDVYSLGVVIYQMVTGQPPFGGGTPMEIIGQHISQPPQSPRKLNPNLTRKQEEIILKALKKKPEKRYQRAGDFTKAFVATITGSDEIAIIEGSRWERIIEGRTWGAVLRVGRFFNSIFSGFLGFITRSLAAILFGFAVVLVILAFVAANLIGRFLGSAISDANWGFDRFGVGHSLDYTFDELEGHLQDAGSRYLPGTISEVELISMTGSYVRARFQIQDTSIVIDLDVILEDGHPVIVLKKLNHFPMIIVGGLITRDVNQAFETALIDDQASIPTLEISAAGINIVIDGPAAQTSVALSNTVCVRGESVQDDFSDIYSGWMQSYSNNQVAVGYKAGAYNLSTMVSNIIIKQALPCPFTSFDASVETQPVDEPGDAAWGLVFYEIDADNYWVFQINDDGWYSVFQIIAGEHFPIVDWTQTAHINANAINTLRVRVNEDGRIFINNTTLGTFDIPPESVPPEGGSFGFLLRSGQQANVEIIFDNLDVTLP